MTASYSISVKLQPAQQLVSPTVVPEAIVAIIPAYNDQEGLHHTLRNLDRFKLMSIVVVDDGSDIPLRIPQDLITPIFLIRHESNKGAAAARNSGCSVAKSDWVYFTDCGCSFSDDIFKYFSKERENCSPCTSAIVGPVEASSQGRLSNYYTHQGILNAPMLVHSCGTIEVETIITANALVSYAAIESVGGFDETFPSAGGEDTDLGIRLRTVGRIEWCEQAVVFHEFKECLLDFDTRMRRYGKGIHLVSKKLGFDLRPQPFRAFDSKFSDLAERQYQMMLLGFDESK